jgi:hypothetical protein
MKNDDTLYDNYTMYVNNNDNDVPYDDISLNDPMRERCMFCLSLLAPIIIMAIVFISLRLS